MPHSRLLHPASATPASLDGDVLAAIAEGLGATVGPQRPAPVGVVRRVRLLETSIYDAWLTVWGPGAATDSHDHDGSICSVHVVEGALCETMRHVEGGSITTVLPAGSTTSIGPIDSHHLTSARSRTTVSIHVFSPPLGDSADHH